MVAQNEEDIAIQSASNHHEKMDGSGYPLHLEKEHLTLADRIISIADIFTALTEDRPYRKGMAWQEALQIMEADVINGAVNDVAELAIVAEKFAGHVAVLPHLTQLLIIQLALFFENGEWDIDLANIV